MLLSFTAFPILLRALCLTILKRRGREVLSLRLWLMLWQEYSQILDFLGHFPFSFLMPRYFISVYRVIYTEFVYFIWNITSLSNYSLIAVSIRLFSLKFELMFIPLSLIQQHTQFLVLMVFPTI